MSNQFEPNPRGESDQLEPAWNTIKWRRDQVTKVKESCPIKEICGTCDFVNSDYLAGLKTKFEKDVVFFKESQLLEKAVVLAPSPSPKPFAYRAHAKLAVRSTAQVIEPQRQALASQRFAVGLFKRGTHELVDLAYCPLHRSTINQVVKDLRPLLESSMLDPYNEELHMGDLRYITIRASHLTDELMITFVVTRDCLVELKKIVQELKKAGHKVTSAHMNLNPDLTNAIFGSSSKRVAGAERLRESLCGFDFEIGATSFFQVNPWMADMIYRRLESLFGQGRGRAAWDLYSGTGTISMLMARAGYQVLGIEENPQAGRDAQYNVTRNEAAKTPFFLTGRVEDQLHALPNWAQNPSLVLVNPSRRGLDETVAASLAFELARLDDALFIYLSCEAKTLVRDLAWLKSSGIEVRQLEAYDMFPHTDKLEWIAVAQRVSQ